MWKNYTVHDIPWKGRAGHTATLEGKNPTNGNVRRLYIVGGVTGDDHVPSDETWVLQIDDKDDIWRMDYGPDALYRYIPCVTISLSHSLSPRCQPSRHDTTYQYIQCWLCR